MDKTKYTGCWQIILIGALLLWLGIAPPVAALAVNKTLSEVIAPGAVSAVAILVAGALLLPPYVGAALLACRCPAWKETAAVAASGAVVAGYFLLNAMVRAMFPESAATSLHGEGAWAAALQMGLLLPYALLAAWLAPRLARAPRRSIWAWLGLNRFDWPTLLLALAVAALVTIPWPVTGALGDSLTSLSLAFQTLATTLSQILLFWGVIFCLLTSTFTRPWSAALTTLMLYGLSAFGGVLPSADWSAVSDLIFLLPLALLLAELRAREGGVYPLLPLLFCYRVAPLLFVDSRDILAQGIPELQHILSYATLIASTLGIGLILWIGRWALRVLQDSLRIPAWARLVAAALAAAAFWGIWTGTYFFIGAPGFTNDGFLIILEEQADLSDASTIADKEARLEYVRQTLIETAEDTQAPLRAELDQMGLSYRPYYIINMIRVDGRRWLMGQFEGQPGVAQVILNPNAREYPHTIPFPENESDEPPSRVQSNLAAIHADEAWELGVTGEGIVVAGQDTGYDWTHPALKSHYRGWNGQSADHDCNWHDAWDDTVVPFDDHSHGTHTMGILVGDDGGANHTGVAPGARWIGCRNMRRGYGNPASYTECMEFFLAPYPHGGDPFSDGDVGQAPHLVTNSWGCPYWEGCSSGTLKPALDALRAAGIMMIVSAGNEGPACNTATTPPANYDAAFSIGATGGDGSIVGFSSRGPVGELIKPDIAAPGSGVRSSVPDGYANNSGTSMAAPHVAGVVALLWSADPNLIGDIDATESLICQTATPKPVEKACTVEDEAPGGPYASLFPNSSCACGDVTGTPNNVYGCGNIDAGSAVQAALED